MDRAKELHALTGGLSCPSKIPGYAYGLSAYRCRTGSVLRQRTGSVCSRCYAYRGNYPFPVVQNAQQKRLQATLRPDWVANMTELISLRYRGTKRKDRVFRWHDSGDLQSLEHFYRIVAIAKALPSIKFWLPTKERRTIRRYLAIGNIFPPNLIVRISATMIGQQAGKDFHWSTVGAGTGFACPASEQGNNCMDCRACWDKRVNSVDYPLH